MSTILITAGQRPYSVELGQDLTFSTRLGGNTTATGKVLLGIGQTAFFDGYKEVSQWVKVDEETFNKLSSARRARLDEFSSKYSSDEAIQAYIAATDSYELLDLYEYALNLENVVADTVRLTFLLQHELSDRARSDRRLDQKLHDVVFANEE